MLLSNSVVAPSAVCRSAARQSARCCVLGARPAMAGRALAAPALATRVVARRAVCVRAAAAAAAPSAAAQKALNSMEMGSTFTSYLLKQARK